MASRTPKPRSHLQVHVINHYLNISLLNLLQSPVTSNIEVLADVQVVLLRGRRAARHVHDQIDRLVRPGGQVSSLISA
jgi:hypothetical protein